MARKPKDSSSESAYEQMNSMEAATEVHDDSAPLVDDTPHRGGAKKTAPDEPRPVPVPVPRFVCRSTGYIMHRGNRSLIRIGKIVDRTNFNLDSLREQGIVLELVEEVR